MCAAVPVRALLQLCLYWAWNADIRVYTELGGGWPLRGMGAAGTALGAADARTENIMKSTFNAILFLRSNSHMMSRGPLSAPHSREVCMHDMARAFFQQ